MIFVKASNYVFRKEHDPSIRADVFELPSALYAASACPGGLLLV